MDKLPIEHRVARGEPGYGPLMPLVRRVVSQGGRFTDGKTLARPFSDTPNGYACTMVTALTMEALAEMFDFPKHFVMGVPVAGCVWDKRHNAHLCLTRP